ncbi:MAG: hypothetical protein ACE5HE_06450 [Phycisphaerae bacterium]
MRRLSLSSIGLWALMLLVIPTIAGCFNDEESLVSVGSEKEANRVLVALEDSGIHGAHKAVGEHKRKTVYEILVSSDQAHEARQLLLQLDIPRESHGGFEAMFSHSGLIPTRTDERARLMHAMAGELERTLEVVERVVQARVHLVIPERDPLGAASGGRSTGPGPTAAVLIKYVPSAGHHRDGRSRDDRPGEAVGAEGADPAGDTDADEALDDGSAADLPISVEEVRRLVACSVEDLAEENVTVTFARARRRGGVSAPVGLAESVQPAFLDVPADGVDQGRWVQDALLVAVGVLVLLVIYLVFRLRRARASSLA